MALIGVFVSLKNTCGHKRIKHCCREMSLNYDDKFNQFDDNGNSMEYVVLNNNFANANEQEIDKAIFS